MITRLRLDCNKTKDCKYRSFKFKNTPNDLCIECGNVHDVSHILLHCSRPELSEVRIKFMQKYKTVVKDFDLLSDVSKLKQILNVNPSCKEDKGSAVNLICGFIKQIFSVI